MWPSMLKTAAVTAVYALAHTVFASDVTKRHARALVGDRAYDGLYRGFYNAQAVGGLVALGAYLRSLPDRELYRATGTTALALRAGQAAGLAYVGWAQWHVGPLRFTGLDSMSAWAAGRGHIPEAAVGQGPSPGVDGEMQTGGPFRHCRHPLNVATPVILWLNPTMTTNLATFNALATVYFIVGSLREEMRLRAAYGDSYARYQRSDVPFLVPSLSPHSVLPTRGGSVFPDPLGV